MHICMYRINFRIVSGIIIIMSIFYFEYNAFFNEQAKI